MVNTDLGGLQPGIPGADPRTLEQALARIRATAGINRADCTVRPTERQEVLERVPPTGGIYVEEEL